MSKVRYQQPVKKTTTNNLARQLEELSGSLEEWLKCREERINAQVKLLNSCNNDKDVNRYKAMGLLNLTDTNL